jgi:hypothetical protein
LERHAGEGEALMNGWVFVIFMFAWGCAMLFLFGYVLFKALG